MSRGCQESSRSEWPVRYCCITWQLVRSPRDGWYESEEYSCPENDDVTWFLQLKIGSGIGSGFSCGDVYLTFRSKRAEKDDPYKDGICFIADYTLDGSAPKMNKETATWTLLSSFRAYSKNEKDMAKLKKKRTLVAGINLNADRVLRVDVYYIEEPKTSQQIGSVSRSKLLSSLSKDMESAMLGVDDRTADVVLVDKKGKAWRVHKFILMARSPVFAAMFRTDMVENKSGRVDLKDVSGDLLSQLIRYMYTGDVDRGTLGVDLMALAHRYELNMLKELCEKTLARTVSVANVLDVLEAANLYDSPELRDAALKFIKTNIEAVKGSPAWSSVLPNELKQIVDLLL